MIDVAGHQRQPQPVGGIERDTQHLLELLMISVGPHTTLPTCRDHWVAYGCVA